MGEAHVEGTYWTFRCSIASAIWTFLVENLLARLGFGSAWVGLDFLLLFLPRVYCFLFK